MHRHPNHATTTLGLAVIAVLSTVGLACTSDTSKKAATPSTSLPESSGSTLPDSVVAPETSIASTTTEVARTLPTDTTTTSTPQPKLADAAPQIQALLDASLQPGALDWTLNAVDVPATGVAIAIRVPGSPDLLLASGTNVDHVTPFDPNGTFNIATVTSTIIQNLAFQFISDGTLDPSAPMSTWFPEYPNADKITVEMLLDETNGMGDFGAREGDLILADLTKTWTLDEVLAEAATQPVIGEPGIFQTNGGNWTGTIAIGRILELVTGEPLSKLVDTRVAQPLGLTHTALSDGTTPAGFQQGMFQLNGKVAGTTGYPRTAYVTFGGPVRGMDSTVTELLTYLDATTHGAPPTGTTLTDSNFQPSRLNDRSDLIIGSKTGWNGWCPCTPTTDGATVTFIGRGPSGVGTTVQLYEFTDTNISIVIHYNSSEIKSFEEIHPMIEKIKDLVATYL